MMKMNAPAMKLFRRPWRQRISNQLAVIAAIMLFASTQIGMPGDTGKGFTPEAEIAANVAGSTAGMQGLANQPMMDQASREKSGSVATSSKKRSRLKLDLFLFRR